MRPTSFLALFSSATAVVLPWPKLSGGLGSTKPFTVAITGSSGLIGTALRKELSEGSPGRKVKVLRLVRRPAQSDDEVAWDPVAGTIESSKLEGIDAMVHLAGEGVASGSGLLAPLGRWDGDKKEKILESRVESTRTIVAALRRLKRPPAVFICSSGVGFYGYDRGNTVFDESCSKGSGFLAEVSDRWEKEARAAAGVCKVICLRTGVVMAKEGGALGKLLPIFQLGAGGTLGAGSQYFSWISMRDLVGIVLFALTSPQKLAGAGKTALAVNACAPEPCTNAAFTAALGKAIRRPAIFPVPETVGSIVFGEMGKEMLFGGQRAVPQVLEKAGFAFKDRTIDQALGNIFARK